MSILLILDTGFDINLNGRQIKINTPSVIITGGINKLNLLKSKSNHLSTSYLVQINTVNCNIDLSDLYLNNILIGYFDNYYILKLINQEMIYQIKGTLQEINKEYDINKMLNNKMVKLLVERFLIKYLRYYVMDSPIDNNTFSSNFVVSDFIKLVNIHYRSKKKLKEYASLLNISPKTLSNIFSKSNLKITPSSIIKDKLLKEAKMLVLNNPNISGKEISYKLGFNNPNNFFILFRNKERMSFTEYCKKVKLNNN